MKKILLVLILLLLFIIPINNIEASQNNDINVEYNWNFLQVTKTDNGVKIYAPYMASPNNLGQYYFYSGAYTGSNKSIDLDIFIVIGEIIKTISDVEVVDTSSINYKFEAPDFPHDSSFSNEISEFAKENYILFNFTNTDIQLGEVYIADEEFNSLNCSDYSKTKLLNHISNNGNYYTITGQWQNELVIDEKPIITNPSAIRMVNIKDDVTIDDILEGITASDELDGDLTNKIIIEKDEYTPNKKTIGTYEILLSVEDNSGNKTYCKILIDVYENLAPVISNVKDEYITSYNKLLDFDELFKDISIIDDRTPKEELVIDINVDSYINNYNKVGDYIITISASDKENNTTIKEITIKVIDIDKPIFAFDKNFIILTDQVVLIEDDLIRITNVLYKDLITDKVSVYDVNLSMVNYNVYGEYDATVRLLDKDGELIERISYTIAVYNPIIKSEKNTSQNNIIIVIVSTIVISVIILGYKIFNIIKVKKLVK